MIIGPGHGRILPSYEQPCGGETRVLETFTFLTGDRKNKRTQPIPQKRKKRKKREGEERSVTSSCQDKSGLK